MSNLNGKVAVITGGSSGIGLATAQRFVAEGAYVFIVGRRQTELEKAKALIGKNVTAVQGDTASLEDLDRVYETIKKEKGILHIVVASAGITEVSPPSTQPRRNATTRCSTSTLAARSLRSRRLCR
jgi:NAD(P)-dependent dehydrogenase (short-subunit alcohol dehydrogenase family)